MHEIPLSQPSPMKSVLNPNANTFILQIRRNLNRCVNPADCLSPPTTPKLNARAESFSSRLNLKASDIFDLLSPFESLEAKGGGGGGTLSLLYVICPTQATICLDKRVISLNGMLPLCDQDKGTRDEISCDRTSAIVLRCVTCL